MNTSSAMESNFTLDQANYVGRLESSFLAEVCRMEEGVLQSARLMPYLRVMLTQDGGATIMDAIAIGNFYHVEKYVYKVGNVYRFPRGMFEIRPRTSQDSLSSYRYDLWFLNFSVEKDSLKKIDRLFSHV
ncbi:uncharacterized protein LOC110857317 [Folsomia candida]|uniref:uncharacterized protein LOC110857317 n=1 Tax=Folsomia candida TaxID=158441 RepID=UPI000B8F680D|nr:uncharacterized protein LOC110857317 [Folsomia candida]